MVMFGGGGLETKPAVTPLANSSVSPAASYWLARAMLHVGSQFSDQGSGLVQAARALRPLRIHQYLTRLLWTCAGQGHVRSWRQKGAQFTWTTVEQDCSRELFLLQERPPLQTWRRAIGTLKDAAVQRVGRFRKLSNEAGTGALENRNQSWTHYQNEVIKQEEDFKGRVEVETAITELGHLQTLMQEAIRVSRPRIQNFRRC